MKKEIKIIIFTFIIVILVALVVFIYNPKPQSNLILNNNSNYTNGYQKNNESLKIDSLELLKHNKLEDCWISYKDKVYDLTQWLPKHPGSAQAILPYCGTSSEFEKAFTDQHNTSKTQKLVEEGIYKGELK